MRFRYFSSKFLVTAATALAVVLILALSASVDAGDKHKNKGGGGGNKQGLNCPPPLVKRGGGCAMPGGSNAGKNNNNNKKANKGQAGNRFDTRKQGGKQHDDNKRAGKNDNKKHGGKPKDDNKFGGAPGGGKHPDDKKQAGKHQDDKRHGGRPQDDKKQAGNDRDDKKDNKQAGKDRGDKKDNKHQGIAGDDGRGGKEADDKKGGKDHGGKHADDNKGDGKHGDDDNKHAGNDGHRDCKPPFVYSWRAKDCVKGEHRGPERVVCKGSLQWRNGRGCVKPGHPGYDCGWPMIKIGRACVCGPGFISRHGECWRPPVVVVPVGPVGPGPYPEGPYPEGPYPEGPYPAGPGPEGPPAIGPGGPPQQAEPLPPEEPGPEPVAEPQPVASIAPAVARCLPDDLYDLLEDTYGKRPDLDRCPAACLPKPILYTPAELDDLADKYGVNWCENCLQVGGYMPLPSILHLERAANVTICVNPDMCRVPSGIGGGGGYAGEPATTIRTVFKDLPAGTDNEGNIAVVVGNHAYQGELPDNPDGSADADAVMALLVDQLGYKQENIIDLRDATLEDLKRVFGSDDDPGGELAKRIDKDDPGDVFIYIASHGLVSEDGDKAYLLPVDAKVDLLDDTAYPMQDLYDNLGKIGARTIMLMLETTFANNLDALIDPPNLPELEVEAMPAEPVPGLAVFKASDRDQKAIQDPEYGIGLFTRYLIEGLAGRADEAPLGNDDKSIDTVELYVYTADAVRTAARKSFGLEQKPVLSKIDNLVVGKLSSN
jgi:hypothetical protein